VLGGTQSLHTTALTKAIALPTDFSSRIGPANTQLILQEKPASTKRHRPPWRAATNVEKLTADLAMQPGKLIESRKAGW